MKVLQIFENNINERFMDQVIEALNAGEVIIYPTDTLYALGCDALNNNAIQRICRIKGINPEKTNLSIICSDLSQAADDFLTDDVEPPLDYQYDDFDPEDQPGE